MEEILINMLFLFVVLLVTQHILEVHTKKFTKKSSRLFFFFAALISIFFCMTFPLSIQSQFLIDIRVVPFIIASLYGGPLVSVGLYLFIVLYRLSIGVDQGFYGTTLNYVIIPIVTHYVYPFFKRSGTRKRLIIAVAMVCVHLLLSQFIYTYLFVSHTPLVIVLLGAFIKTLSLIIILVTIDRIILNYQLRNKAIDIEKMETISHLSASISHEVRNGLTGAKGFIQLLEESETNPDKRKYIRYALDELKRSEEIIRDFLTFAKPSPEKIESINVETLINQTLELIWPQAKMNGIVIEKNTDEFWIQCDGSLLQQAFLNVFKNALEAMLTGGKLTVEMVCNDNSCVINISDTGVGMTAEQIERLGKPYFTTKGQKGTGLGLMVSYRVIHELRGKIKIMSKIGNGTKFSIHIPGESTGEPRVL